MGFSTNYSFGNNDWIGFSSKGGTDATIVKYDNNGEVVWKNNFGGSSDDSYYSVTAGSDGIVAVGRSLFESFGNGDWTSITGKGGRDAIIVKYNHNGEVVWKKNFGGSDNDSYESVIVVSDGIVAAGNSYSASFENGDWEGVSGKGDYDAIIVKYNPDGEVVWNKNFGSAGYDYYNSITVVSDGIVVGGRSESNSFGNNDWSGVEGKGGVDAIIVKYNPIGEVVWKKNFGGEGYDGFTSVTAVSDGIIAVGNSVINNAGGTGDWAGYQGNGGSDAIIVKYNQDGEVVGKNNFGGNDADLFTSTITVSNGIIVVGHSGANSFGTHDWAGISGKGCTDAVIVKYSTQEDFFSDGSGTENDPYIIYTAEELAQLATFVNEGNTQYNDKHYKLGKWIDLSNYQSGTGWIPIGESEAKSFNPHYSSRA